MCVLNGMSRFDLASEAIRRVPHLGERAEALRAECAARTQEAVDYADDHFEDPPAIRDWVWTDD
jgi:xylulose-5-phosphate/fructose-6-phosphate phosphoketolase